MFPAWVCVLLLMLVLYRLTLLKEQGERIMAGEKELAERVKALEAIVTTSLTTIEEVAVAAAADIAKIHDLLDASTGSGADVEGANAALDAIESKLTNIAATIATLKEAVDRPEPGDEPPPPVE